MQDDIKLIFDEKTLIPAIVQDYYSGMVLMLAYVNRESYEYMLKNGKTCFWSRSRQKLWQKGKTTGNIQIIKSISFDCDKDTILIQVEQKGIGACHLGKYSCFGQNDIAIYNIISEIEKLIDNRKRNAKENSYTNYLFDSGIDKICKKIGEEATEVVIAAKNKSKANLIGEISDLIYHTLVLMNVKHVTTREILEELSKRHRDK